VRLPFHDSTIYTRLLNKSLSSGQFNPEDNDAHKQTDEEQNQQSYPDNIRFATDMDADDLVF